nr:MAG TPA: tail assembly chaperone protein [Caudoviricetes sp.]
MAQVTVFNKEYDIDESIKNVKKTLEVQKKFLDLDKKADSKDTVKAIEELMDVVSHFIVDITHDKEVTLDHVEKYKFNDVINKVTEIINAILHINPDEEKEENEKNE